MTRKKRSDPVACSDFRVTQRWANQHSRKLKGTFTGTGQPMLLPTELSGYTRITIYPEGETRLGIKRENLR
jgi:hypothetical protein